MFLLKQKGGKKMKKRVLLLFAAFAFSQAAFALYDFSVIAPSGQTLYYRYIHNYTYTVSVVAPGTNTYHVDDWSHFTKPTGDLVIPDSVEDNEGVVYYVARIENNAFKNCSGLTSVTFGNSVTSIGSNAFNNCSGLTTVNYTGLIEQWCYILFDNSTSNPTSCSHSLNINGSPLTNLVIPNSVSSIGQYAFSDCYGLTSVTIPNSVTSIGSNAFYNCSGLTTVNYTGTIERWCNILFDNSTSNPTSYSHSLNINGSPLTNLVIPNSVTSIGNYAFCGCSCLTSVTIPNSVTSIGSNAFYNCSGLTSVTIPNSVASIGGDAFGYCSGLTSVTIPNSVTRIGSGAFGYCSGLTSVTIPNSVINIGWMAFEYCSGLTSVTIIGNPATSIGMAAFQFCSGLTSVTIGDSITSIGDAVFLNCSGLTSVTIPNSVTQIGAGAFGLCSGLTTVTIGNSVTSIGNSAFSGCSGLTSMKITCQMPPQLGTDVFEGIPTDIPVYIPCGRIAYYVNQMPQFSNFIETMVGFSAVSDDASMGTVQVLTAPSCTDHNAVLNAVPADGYRFDHWSTGSTDNPYTLTVTTDTTIIAYFVSSGTQGIGEVEEDDIHIKVFNGRICVEGITNEEVRVYDITGRMVQNHSLPSGVYIVKVGTLPAQKVVVMR